MLFFKRLLNVHVRGGRMIYAAASQPIVLRGGLGEARFG
jgi:hypothetical protein